MFEDKDMVYESSSYLKKRPGTPKLTENRRRLESTTELLRTSNSCCFGWSEIGLDQIGAAVRAYSKRQAGPIFLAATLEAHISSWAYLFWEGMLLLPSS